MNSSIHIKCKSLEDFLKNEKNIINQINKKKLGKIFPLIKSYYFEIDNLNIEFIEDSIKKVSGENFTFDGFCAASFPYENVITNRKYQFKQKDYILKGQVFFVNQKPPIFQKGDNVNVVIIHNHRPPITYIGKVQKV